MNINGIDYPVIDEVRVEELGGIIVPIVDIPMMSDERWVELTNMPEQIERRKLRSMQKDGGFNG